MTRRYSTTSVRAVIVRKGAVLLALHEHPERSPSQFWCFPGGAVEAGEDLHSAVRRELHEEAGLTIEPQGIIYLQDFPQRNMLDVFFRARVISGNLRLGCDPEPGADHLRDIRWIRLSELANTNVLPLDLAQRLAHGLALPAIPFFVV